MFLKCLSKCRFFNADNQAKKCGDKDRQIDVYLSRDYWAHSWLGN